jgi:hypothetical protein
VSKLAKVAAAYPNGTCYCGCGGKTAPKSLWIRGHDRVAMQKVLAYHYPGLDTAQIMLVLAKKTGGNVGR